MTFESRNSLLKLVQYNMTAYSIAHEFVADDPNKYIVFSDALASCKEIVEIKAKTAAAIEIARTRWDLLNA